MFQHRKQGRDNDQRMSPRGDTHARPEGGGNAMPPRLSRWKKSLFAVVATVAFYALLEGLLWLAGVQTDHEKSDPYAGFVSHVPHFVEQATAGAATQMEVAPNKAATLNDIAFTKHKAPGTFRIFCVGGSTTFGRPFFDETSFSGWLRLFLPAADSSRKWEVINAGAIGYASYRVVGLMEELVEYEPDLFIIYVGHNEFLERRTYDQLLRQPGWLRETASLVSHTRTASLIRQALQGVGVSSASSRSSPALTDAVESIPVDAVGPEAYHRDDAFRHNVVRHFEASLDRMLAAAKSVGARVMLVIPASNLADFVPLKSQPSVKLSPEAEQRWQRHYADALRLTRAGQFEPALAELQQAATMDEGRADLHFARGQLLLGLQRYGDAGVAFRRAKEEDICPLRAIDPIAETVRRAVELSGAPSVDFVDFEELLARHSPHGIPGKEHFHDHVHPKIESNRVLAVAIIEQLADADVIRLDPDWNSQTADRLAAEYQARWDRSRMARELLRLSSLLIALKQDFLAIEQLQAALELGSESEEILPAVAPLLEQVAGGAFAVRILQQYVENHPQSAIGQYHLGFTLLKRRETNAALSAFEAGLSLDPDLQPALHYAGLLNAELGNLAVTEKHFRRLVAIAPDSAGAHANLALAIAQQGRHQEALSHYQRALQLDPQSASAHANAARTYRQLGRAEEASEHQEIAESLEEQSGKPEKNTPSNYHFEATSIRGRAPNDDR